MVSEQEKAELGAATLTNFCHQFGNDVYARTLLEVLFEGLINAETLFIFGEQEQKGDQADYSPPKSRNGECSSERPDRTEAPGNLGETDRPDYP